MSLSLKLSARLRRGKKNREKVKCFGSICRLPMRVLKCLLKSKRNVHLPSFSEFCFCFSKYMNPALKRCQASLHLRGKKFFFIYLLSRSDCNNFFLLTGAIFNTAVNQKQIIKVKSLSLLLFCFASQSFQDFTCSCFCI